MKSDRKAIGAALADAVRRLDAVRAANGLSPDGNVDAEVHALQVVSGDERKRSIKKPKAEAEERQRIAKLATELYVELGGVILPKDRSEPPPKPKTSVVASTYPDRGLRLRQQLSILIIKAKQRLGRLARSGPAAEKISRGRRAGICPADRQSPNPTHP